MQEVSDIHPPLGFHCIPCISSYLGDDVMMLHQHVTCVSEFEEVLRLFDNHGSWGSEMRLDMFRHFFLVSKPILGVNIGNVIFQFDILASCHFILTLVIYVHDHILHNIT